MTIKICGLTNYEDARLALDLGADELGFVLAPSPRRAEPEAVARILARLRAEAKGRPFSAVGVFVNEDPTAMARLVGDCGLDWAQIHGDEDAATCASFAFPWYRAFRLGPGRGPELLSASPWACPRFLVDAFSASGYGGTGRRLDEALALEAKKAAHGAGKKFILAGGLGPDNTAQAVEALDPDGLDLSSSLEESPGRKSRAKLEALFTALGRPVQAGGQA